MERPTKRAIVFQRSWPFVSVEEVPETRDDHAVMAVLMLAAAVAVVGFTIPDFVAVGPAFIAGDAFSNWLDYPELYDAKEVSA
jgi:hypothetical protein